MPEEIALSPRAPWRELRTTPEDWSEVAPTTLGTMLVLMHLIRAFEEKVLELAGLGLVHGPAHSAIGQEGGAAGSIMALRAGDQINGSHRGHHQFLAKALLHLAPRGFGLEEAFAPDIRQLARRTLAEILGLAEGFCGGRGGSMHLRWTEAGNLGTNAIVGGGVPLAAGAAWCHARAGSGDVMVTCFGDGATNIGSVLETMNMAAAWKLPLCFFIENNRYAVATHVDEVTAEPRLSARGLGVGIPAWKVDGMDPIAVHLAMRAALATMRAGGGPTIVEADVYRYFHQNGPLPGSAFGYRTKEEEASWRARDPLDRVATELLSRQAARRSSIEDLRARSLRIVLFGEDIHRLRGGTNGATRGLAAAFPDRVIGTPISENAFAGLAGGIAMDGRFRPLIEFMYADFSWVAADQVFNQIAKARHMFGGEGAMPLVLRTKCAIGTGYGSQHSLDPAGLYAASVGWRIVAPATPFDYVGLMNAALLCEDPVLVIEHVELYGVKGLAPRDDLDFIIPLGRAKVVRSGSTLTVLTYLAMVRRTLEVVDDLGVDAEVIDLRSLDRAGLDWETIGASVRKTNNVLIVEQGALGPSYGGMLADEVQRRLFDWLDQPVQRVHGGEASPAISRILEAAACASREDVARGMRRVLAERGTPLPGG